MMGDASYQIDPLQWHSKSRQIRVICVGAGAAGLLLAYKMKKYMKSCDLVIYEKNPGIGGTWYENRYPGCACDVPAHAYTYSFEPNPEWSSFYAYAPEIKAYFERFAKKHDLYPYINCNTRVLSATWIEERGIYEIELERDGCLIVKDWCHVLFNGTGLLNKWKWPTIPGLHDFAGTLVHSASWDESIELNGKTIAIIGTGSSAIQIVPQIQRAAKHIIAFMRSVTWISPPIASGVLEKTKADSSDKTQEGSLNAQYYYTDEDKQRFRDHPDELLRYRKELECQFNGMFDIFIAGSETSKLAENAMREEMYRRIGPGHKELKERLIPRWPPGCRRLTPGDGYLEALVKDNVTTVHREIVNIVPAGLVDDAAKLHEVDIIVCATGFDVSHKPSFKVLGVNSANMHDEFDPEPQVYLGMTVPKFPNYFTSNSVRGNWASGTALHAHEVCIDYILKCIQRMQDEDIRALEVKKEPIEDLYEHIDEWHKGSVWNADCKSWYKNNIPGGKLWIWAGSSLHYLKTLKTIRWEHYSIRYNNKNIWGFLGNGRVEAEITKDMSRLTPYVRNEDSPWSID